LSVQLIFYVRVEVDSDLNTYSHKSLLLYNLVIMDTRLCKVCNTEKDVDLFEGKIRGRICKECDQKKIRKWQKNHPENMLANARRHIQSGRKRSTRLTDGESYTWKKDQALGIPLGTATHRLRRSLFFALVVKCGENICYRCEEEITSEHELSIEHKVDWLGNSPELFWDLDNIAYSHRKCNKRNFTTN
jgi:hypothetical protein